MKKVIHQYKNIHTRSDSIDTAGSAEGSFLMMLQACEHVL